VFRAELQIPLSEDRHALQTRASSKFFVISQFRDFAISPLASRFPRGVADKTNVLNIGVAANCFICNYRLLF
jgi:hypothetical protein